MDRLLDRVGAMISLADLSSHIKWVESLSDARNNPLDNAKLVFRREYLSTGEQFLRWIALSNL